MKKHLKRVAQLILPEIIYDFLLTKWRGPSYVPPVGKVKFGDLRRLKPISDRYGFDRGIPVDRYYIEKFLSKNSGYIKGRVLEIGDDSYTIKYGGNQVIQSDILNLDKRANPKTSIEADLTNAPQIPSDSFDCIIFTQTLMFIYDIRSAVETLHRILKPNGVLLATLGGIQQTAGDQAWDKNWCWHFTSTSASRLFKEVFQSSDVDVEAYGNVLSAVSLLQGLALSELQHDELNFYDPEYQILVGVKVVK